MWRHLQADTVDCSSLPDTPCTWELSRNAMWISLLTKNATVRTSEFPLLLNVGKRAQFSCQCLHLRSTTTVTRLTKHDDVIKPLLRRAPRLGLALGPAPARDGLAYEHLAYWAELKLGIRFYYSIILLQFVSVRSQNQCQESTTVRERQASTQVIMQCMTHFSIFCQACGVDNHKIYCAAYYRCTIRPQGKVHLALSLT